MYAIPDDNVVYAIPLEGMGTGGGGGGSSVAPPPPHTGNDDAGRLFDQKTTAFAQPQITRRRKEKGDGSGSNTGAPEYDLAAGGSSTNHYAMQARRVRRSGRGAGSPASTSAVAAAPKWNEQACPM